MPSEFGPCCACGKDDDTVRNICTLPYKASVPGTGWGCVVCGLPPDGAVTVLCDDCVESEDLPEITHIIKGYPHDKQREPAPDISKQIPHMHDQTMHTRINDA